MLKTFAKGKVVLRPSNKRIFFLTRGTVKMSRLPKEGILPALNIYKPHALFPMSLVLGKGRDKHTYTALAEVQGYLASKKEFEEFIKKNPEVLFDLLKRIYRGLDGFFARLESLLLGDVRLRILTQLLIYTKRFGQKNQDRITFDWHMTHHHLASETGLARETVTREIRKLQKKGLVGYSGKKLFIYDLLKLEQECISYSNKASL